VNEKLRPKKEEIIEISYSLMEYEIVFTGNMLAISWMSVGPSGRAV